MLTFCPHICNKTLKLHYCSFFIGMCMPAQEPTSIFIWVYGIWTLPKYYMGVRDLHFNSSFRQVFSLYVILMNCRYLTLSTACNRCGVPVRVCRRDEQIFNSIALHLKQGTSGRSDNCDRHCYLRWVPNRCFSPCDLKFYRWHLPCS